MREQGRGRGRDVGREGGREGDDSKLREEMEKRTKLREGRDAWGEAEG